MMRKTLAALTLVVAFGTTAFIPTTAFAQPQEPRVYDRDHRDYHNWNSDEDRLYRDYLMQQHRSYQDFSRLNHKQQREYWRWRHEHDGRR